MGSFGENLRREREMRSVTLEEMADATKISLRALQALEAEEFRKLPGGIFNRSFVRTYARYLGLDEDKVMAEYQAVCPKNEDVDMDRFNPVKPPARKEAPRGRLVVLTLALTLLAAGYALYIFSHRRSAAVSPPASSAANVSPSASSPAAGNVAASNSLKTPEKIAPAQSSELVLQVAATERSWVAVDADGKSAFQRILNPHDIQTVKAARSFDFVTGNAQGVILTLNGETLKPLGQHGEFKKLHLTRDDVKNLAP
jgi:cytoskeletal protein RodZ